MNIVKFCRAPSGLWCGVTEYNGGHVFSAGRTLDDLLKRIKNNLYATSKGSISVRAVVLDSKQHETYEFEKLYKVFMSNMFLSKFWKEKNPKTEREPDMYVPRTYIKRKETPEEQVDTQEKAMRISKKDEFVTEMDGDTLVVYVLREVARYKLHGEKKEPAMTAVPVKTYEPEPVLNIPFSNPARTSVIQERYAGPQDVPFRHQVDTSITGVVLANAEPESPVLQPDSESQEENLDNFTQD